MPRVASNSARHGPTPLIKRTSVPRFIVIDIMFISFPLRTFPAAAKRRNGSGETCVPTIRIYRVMVPRPKRGGPRDGRPSDKFRQARTAPLGGGGNPRRAVRLQVFFPCFPRSL